VDKKTFATVFVSNILTPYFNHFEKSSTQDKNILNFASSSHNKFCEHFNDKNNILLFLTNMYREGTIQTLPQSVLSASYMQPWQPFYPLLPGDRIIFENNKNNVHTITEIIPSITASNGSSSFGLRVVPGITTGSIVSNFCIYRILNNGSQIMIDQEKPTGTAALAFRGFIRPKYISQELDTKFTEIINKLEADGIIE
jgi:hypothetical protein